MGLIFAIIVGVVVGGIGGAFMRENFDYVIIDSLLGISGAIIGDALYFLLTGAEEFLLFSWGALLAEAVVALIAVLSLNFLQRISPKKESFESTDVEGD